MKRKPLMTKEEVRKSIADGWKPAINGWKTKAGATKIAEVDFTKKESKATMRGFCFMHVDGLTQGQLRELVDHVKEAQPNCKINFVNEQEQSDERESEEAPQGNAYRWHP